MHKFYHATMIISIILLFNKLDYSFSLRGRDGAYQRENMAGSDVKRGMPSGILEYFIRVEKRPLICRDNQGGIAKIKEYIPA